MQPITLLHQRRIILGTTGSIAVYKAVDLASKLTQAGALVDVIMTQAARQFVTPLTFQAVTGRPVYTDMWQAESSGGLGTHIAHVGLGEGADLLAVIPATANTLAKLAAGIADDLLSVTALATRAPLLLAPAMDGSMYDHPATQANRQALIERGAYVVEPETGRFASGLTGKGRLPETATLIGHIRLALAATGPLRGRRVVVTAGGTREPLDPVRFIGNPSTGKQGYALAQAALDAGAQVTLITTVTLPAPVGAHVVPVQTARQMHDAVLHAIKGADALLMAAAVADYRPSVTSERKIKKGEGDMQLDLTRNPDILLAVKEQRAVDGWPRVVVGFAAETDHLLENAGAKLTRKGLDMLIANDITKPDAGFAADTNRVSLLYPGGHIEDLPPQSKALVAEAVLNHVIKLLQ